MTPELTYLTYAAILLIVHALGQATLSDLSKGLGWALGPQDEPREQNAVADRVQRALRNYLETLPAFVAIVVVLTATETSNATSALGAATWFWARVVYIPVYASGVPVLRSIVFFVSLAGLAMMIVTALSGGA